MLVLGFVADIAHLRWASPSSSFQAFVFTFMITSVEKPFHLGKWMKTEEI